MTFRFLSLLSFCAVTAHVASSNSLGAPKISHPIVLLPDDPRATFEISAENGCFDFSTDREDLLRLTPKQSVDGGCLRSVIVSLQPEVDNSATTTRDTSSNVRAVVVATETTTMTELRSEVYFSSISRLEILTRIRRLSVGELEAIQVQGYDKFGNTFSSLEGVLFGWNLVDPSTGKQSKIVGIVPLKSTEYALSQQRIEIEEKGHQSDLLIVVGWSPGKTSVSVSLPSTSITSIPVTMSVVEIFFAKPSSIAIPSCGHSTISLITRTGPVSLPDSAYSFAVPSVARPLVLVDTSGKISSLNSSSSVQTTVSITDIRTIGENEEHVRVCIGKPSELEIVPSVLFPVMNEPFQFKVSAKSSECPKMIMELPASDSQITLEISGGIQARRESTSEAIYSVDGLAKGQKISISASLVKVGNPGCEWQPSGGSIKAKPVSIQAVERIHVAMKKILLPDTQDSFVVAVTGGSGQYKTQQISGGTDCLLRVDNSSSFIHVSGRNCSGSIAVADAKNVEGNVEKFSISRFPPTSGDLFRLGSNSTVIEAFIGYERPFTDTITFGEYYNCSSLIESVYMKNDSVASVVWSSFASEPKSCGNLRITQKIPGKTELIVKSVVSKTEWKIPVIVHSPFKLKPEIRLFNSTKAVVAVNATIAFNVAGGSLSTLRLPTNEEPIVLSHPWVADTSVDILKNKFSVVCKTVGTTIVSVAFSKLSAFTIDCVEPDSVSIGSSDSISTPPSSPTLFVTCGHEENQFMRAIAMDEEGQRIDVFSFLKIVWNKEKGTENKFVVTPMNCDTEQTVDVDVTLSNGKILKSRAVIKARNTVRSTLGPLLVAKPMYVPCEVNDDPLVLSLGFAGGSGSYALVDNETDTGFSAMASPIPSNILSIGDVGAFNVQFNGRKCGNKVSTLTVKDTRLNDERMGKIPVVIRQLPVTEFTASIAPIILRNEWIKLDYEIKFSDGMVFESLGDDRWFAVTNKLFGWSTDSPADIELSFENNLMVKYLGKEAKKSMKIFSKTFPNIFAILDIIVIDRPQFATAFTPKWSLVPVTGSYELAVDGVDLSVPNIKYDFETDDYSKIKPVSISPSIVLIDPQPVKKTTSLAIRFRGVSTISGLEIFSIEQTIEIKSFSTSQNVLINDHFSKDPIIVHKNIAVPFFVNLESLVPPVDLDVDACSVKWTIGTEELSSTDSQSITHVFSNLGDYPVKAKIFCEHQIPESAAEGRIFVRVIDPRVTRQIPPLAVFMTGGLDYQNPLNLQEQIITPKEEGSKIFKKSESELGVVLFRSLHRIELDATNSNSSSLLIGSVKNMKLILRDSLGFPITTPNKIDGLSVGSSRPSIVSVSLAGDVISVFGQSSGCSIVFAHLQKILVALTRVCVERSIVPFTDSFILTSRSRLYIKAAESNINTIRLVDRREFEKIITNLDSVSVHVSEINFDNHQITISGDLESVLNKLEIKKFEFVYPVQKSWDVQDKGIVSVNNTFAGSAIVDAIVEGSTVLTLGNNLRIPIQVVGIESIILSPNKFASFSSLVHKQNEEQRIEFLPFGTNKALFTMSPLIDHRFHHACEIDSVEFFSVRPEIDSERLICVVTPIVSSSSSRSMIISRIPKRTTITISVDGKREKFSFSIQTHFHVVSASLFELPIPLHLPVSGDSVQLAIKNLPSGTLFSDCHATNHKRLRYLEISEISSEDGKFAITRTNPGVNEAFVTIACGAQSIDINISFVTVVAMGPLGSLSSGFEDDGFGDSYSSMLLNLLSFIIKVLASLVAIFGVAYLFKRTRPLSPPAGTISKEKKSFGSRTTMAGASPKEFVPHPHPDKDTFFGSSITRRSHIE